MSSRLAGFVGSLRKANRLPLKRHQGATQVRTIFYMGNLVLRATNTTHYSPKTKRTLRPSIRIISYPISSVHHCVSVSSKSNYNSMLGMPTTQGREWTLSNETQLKYTPGRIFKLAAENSLIVGNAIDGSDTFCIDDGKRHTLESAPSGLRGAARLTDSGGLVLCGRKQLVFYDANYDFVASTKLSTGCPNTVAVDTNGNIVLGMICTKTIAFYNPDGTFRSLFHTDSNPLSLAVTSTGYLATSFVDGTLQLLNLKEANIDECNIANGARTISAPSLALHRWQPTAICCSRNGDIFVTDWAHGSLYRYSADGEYLEYICDGLQDPQDICVSPSGEELYVLESGLSSSSLRRLFNGPYVKTFSLTSRKIVLVT